MNLILNETLEYLQIEIKEKFEDYSEEELDDIVKTFLEKQNNYPLGVCLKKDIHKQFHDKYGYGNNTIEQWNEFVDSYKNSNIKIA